MKKIIHAFVITCLLGVASTTKAQVLFSESFDGATGFATQGWTLIDADGATINANVAGQFGTTASWIIDPDYDDVTDSVALSTSWMDPVTATDDWMITPMITGVNANTMLSWEEEAQDAAYPDGYQVWICTSIAGATPVTTDFTVGGTQLFSTPAASGGAWLTQTVSLAPYAGNNVWLAWRNNSTDMFVLMIDNVLVEDPVAADDLAVDSLDVEYTIIPMTQLASMPLLAYCSNPGTTNITDAVLTANVYYNAGLVQTTTSTATAINSGANATLTAGTYTPGAVGVYDIEYIISTALGADADPSNDTITYTFVVDDNYYARDDANITLALGIGPASTATLGNVYAVNGAAIMDSVFFFRNGVLGDTTQVVVYDMSGGLPSTMIGFSAEHVFTPADSASAGAVYVLAVTDLLGGPLVLAPGDYYVGIKEYFTTNNMGLGYTDNIYTPSAGLGNINGGAFATVESFGFQNVAVVRPRFVPNCTAFAFSSTSTDAGCGLSDGTATAVATTGTAPYTYMWDAAAGSQTTQTATNLAAGSYIVTVTDANGCSGIDTVVVANPNAPTGTAAVDNHASCNGGNDGAATVVGSGGTAPYTYAWDAAAGNQTTATATGLAAGTYICTITDASGCSATTSVTVTEPTALSSSIVDNMDGTATANATGGTAPYSYMWDAAAGNQTTATATGLAAGTYTCTVTDANGCTTSSSVTTTVGIGDLVNNLDVKVFPNPANSILTVDFNFEVTENITVTLMNNIGQVIEVNAASNVTKGQLFLNVADVANGLYLLEISTSNAKVVKPIVVSH